MLRDRVHFHQPFVTHLSDGKTDISRLNQYQSPPKMFA
ncbi:Uncharacterized membrane protein yigM [Yersinia kristensenii ATCC 33638]|nr:Uncharacterized membrane protein yigM [Yersinia kristensenii ATCC 33638]